MKKFDTLSDAIKLAEFAHSTQIDKAGFPYIEHPKRVLLKVEAQGALPHVQIAAILHDVTEDTSFTPDILLMLGLPEAAVQIIKLLDRNISSLTFHQINQGRDFAQGRNKQGKRWYMSLGPDAEDEFYYKNIKENPEALLIKLADIEDNMSPERLVCLDDKTKARLEIKYSKALTLLQ